MLKRLVAASDNYQSTDSLPTVERVHSVMPNTDINAPVITRYAFDKLIRNPQRKLIADSINFLSQQLKTKIRLRLISDQASAPGSASRENTVTFGPQKIRRIINVILMIEHLLTLGSVNPKSNVLSNIAELKMILTDLPTSTNQASSALNPGRTRTPGKDKPYIKIYF